MLNINNVRIPIKNMNVITVIKCILDWQYGGRYPATIPQPLKTLPVPEEDNCRRRYNLELQKQWVQSGSEKPTQGWS